MDNNDWFQEMFIDEVKGAKNRWSSGGEDQIGQTYILVDENGAEVPAVYVEDVTVFDATANDIRLGKVAATGEGITTGTKEIPAYITSEGFQVITAGSALAIRLPSNRCEYTKMQALVCTFNTTLSNSVATDMVSIDGNTYAVNSTEVLSAVSVDAKNGMINLGITNEGNIPYIIRYITYKEEF